jgi:hypothetical protein
MPAFTLPARCSALPSSTGPDQHIACILFVVLTIHYTLRGVKFYRNLTINFSIHKEATGDHKGPPNRSTTPSPSKEGISQKDGEPEILTS